MAKQVIKENQISINDEYYTLKGPLFSRFTSPLTGKVNVGDSSLDNQVNLNTWSRKDQTGGLGINDMDESIHADRYWFGNCITDHVGHLFLPRLATAIATLPTTTALTIGDARMEDNDGSWTNGVRDNAQAHTGTYSRRVSTGQPDMTQDIASGTDYKGRIHTFKIWYYQAAGGAGNTFIKIADGVNTTTSSALTRDGTWRQATVTHMASITATKLELVCDNDNDTTAAYFDDAEHVGPDVGTPTKLINYNLNLWQSSGNVLSMLNNSTGTAFDYVYNFPAKIKDLIVSENNDLYIFLGDSDFYWYMEATILDECDAAWTELIDVDVTASADTSDFKTGAASLKLVVGAGAAANDKLATQAITSTDLSGHDYIGMWVKSSVALNAGDIDFMIDDTAKCASPTEHPNWPAIAADTWTYINLKLTYSPSAAVISIGVRMLVDKGAFTLHIDRVEAWDFVQTDVAGATWGIHWDSKLFKFHTDGSGAYATDPSDPTAVANWTAIASLADIASEIERFFIGPDANGNDVIYCATNSRLKVLDFGNDLWLDSKVKLPNHPNGGKGAAYWEGGVYLSFGLGVKRYDVGGTGALSDVGLNRDDGIPSEYNGEIVFLLEEDASDNMFVLVDASQTSGNSKSTVFAYNGRAWKCWWIDTNNNAAMNTAIISSAFGYRLYWDAGGTIYYMDIHRGLQSADQLLGTQKFAASGFHISPWFDAGTQAFDKLMVKLISWAKLITTTETVVLKYRINKTVTDIANGWTTLETLNTSGENGQNKELFASGAGIAVQSIQLGLDLARTTTNTLTPDLQGLLTAYEVMTGVEGFWTYIIEIVCDSTTGGTRAKDKVANIKTALALRTLVPIIKDNSGTIEYARLQLLNGIEQTGVKFQNVYTIQATVY